MKTNIKLAIAPIDISIGDKASNLKKVEDALVSLDSDTDIVVLPELFSTGFSSNPEKLNLWAEGNGGETIAALNALSKKHNVAIAGSFLARTGSMAIYNRAFFIEPGGDETFYDKRHLFSMSSEAKNLERGERRLPVVRFRGWNIAIAVCYDLRFPVWCRNVDNRYDLLIVVANWPAAREYAWRHLLIARAIENQAYVCGVNRTGSDKFGDYGETSIVTDFCGKPLRLKGEQSGMLKYVELDHASLEQWRNDFAVWRDSDNFELKM